MHVSSIKQTSFFTGFNNFKSLLSAATFLILISFFLIGGCSDSDSGSGEADARTIGSIEGDVVPALNKRLNLKEWQEGDPDGDLYLKGSRVASMSDAEKQAVNNAYQMGYIVGLTNAEIDHILEMHEVLGLNPVFADNGTLDLLAFSREFNVSGIRYFIMRPYVDGPIPEDLNLDRVTELFDWAQISSSAVSLSEAELREMGAPTELTSLADSISWTEAPTYPANAEPFVNPNFTTPDLRVKLVATGQAWTVHSTVSGNDFYYLRTNFELTPSSTLGQLGSVCNILCEMNNINQPCPPIEFFTRFTGVLDYTFNNSQAAFNSSDLNVIVSNPVTTISEMTTTSTVDKSFSENVSYSQDDGAEVGVSSGTSYSHSTSYSSPSVTTTADINIGPNMNSAEWKYSVGGSNVARASFEPNFQWIWEATPATRTSGSIPWDQQFEFVGWAYSCTEGTVTTTSVPVLKIQIPVPPLPKDCTANSDCGAGQVCATDLSPAICVAQPCDEMMECPAGFACMNEQCQPSGT